jgi:prolyl-tRNA synthetase
MESVDRVAFTSPSVNWCLKRRFACSGGRAIHERRACGRRAPSYRFRSAHAGRVYASASRRQPGVIAAGQPPARSSEQGSITPRAVSYAQWYLDVIAAAQLADSSPVKGSLVFRPHGWAIWELIREELDRRIRQTGAQNVSFPLLIPQSFLCREAEHVQGFAKECAVVTHHRLRAAPDGAPGALEPDPQARLEEPLVVRPTSETIVWHMFGRWIQSYRDLPLMVNQWCNVVRWELRTRPFLRTLEFFWQEGHTAHATSAEAEAKAREMLTVYQKFLEEWLAIPVIVGTKSSSERFAGAEETFTLEAIMQNGWALQSGTSHFLGQNFARAFDVEYQSADSGVRELVWATSWGLSTRVIGALIMTHSDDHGLVLPPRVAPVQVVIVPIQSKDATEQSLVRQRCQEMQDALERAGVRVHVDARDHIRPGAKYFEWERRGVPLRIEVGMRDLQAEQIVLVDRCLRSKEKLAFDNHWTKSVIARLDAFQERLFNNAKGFLREHTRRVESYDEMKRFLTPSNQDAAANGNESNDEQHITGFFLVPWHDDATNEAIIKQDCKMTIRCYPLDSQDEARGKKCFYSGRPATHMAIFARSY